MSDETARIAIDPGERAMPADRRPPVVDLQACFGESLLGHSFSLEEQLAVMDRLEIARAVLVPQKPPGYHMEAANAGALRAVKAEPDRLLHWCRVDPWQGPRAVKLLADHLDRGAVGLFLHPLQELFTVNDPVVDPLLELCRERERPVMLAGGHVRVSMAWQIAELAERFPEVDLVATSGGQINISGIAQADAETMLVEHGNVWLETSGIYREDFIEDMAARIGAERIVFGSGAPPYDHDLELCRAEWAHLCPEDRARILGENASRLLGIEA